MTVVLLALVLRAYALGSQSFWIDEISVTSFVRSGHLFSDLRDRGGPFEPPLHYLTVLAALQLPIGFETAARIPSALFGGLEVLALILLTREATNRRMTALVAGLLLAVAPFVVRYGQENRYYVMFSALSLFTWWLLLRARRDRRRVAWLGYGATAAAMQLTHPFAPLVLIVQALVVGFTLWRERGTPDARLLRRGYSEAVLLGLVLILPWFAYGASTWVPNVWDGKSYGLHPAGQFAVPLDGELFDRGAGWLLGNAPRLTTLVVLLLVGVFAAPFLARGRERVIAVFTLVYVIGFMLLLVPLARALGTYFAYRRVESFVPPLLLLAAITVVAGVDRLVRMRLDRRVAFGVGAAAVAILAGFSLSATVAYYDTEKTNYRAFARIVREAPGDRPVVVPATREWQSLIRQYLDWKGIDRQVTFIIPGSKSQRPEAQPNGVTWLTGASPRQPALRTRALNDLDSMQVLAGDRSGLLVILPWFVSNSGPAAAGEFTIQRDAVAGLPPFLPAPG